MPLDAEASPPPFAPTETMRLFSAAEIVSLRLPVRKKHWGARIKANQVGMIYGPRGRGKTWVVLSLAISMSSGVSFLGLKPKNARRVIYLDGEMDLVTVRERLASLAKALKTELSNNLRIFTPETLASMPRQITDIEHQREFSELIGDEWDVLVIDNYSAFSGGRETSEAWAPVMQWLLAMKRAGKTVIVVHHAGKNGDQRGSSRHEDALDWSVALEPIQSEDHGDLKFVLRWKKIRHLPESEAAPIGVTLRRKEGGGVEWLHADDEGNLVARARMLAEKGISDAAIGRELNVHRGTVGRWLRG